MDNYIGSIDGVYRGKYRLRRDSKEYHRWLHEQFLVSIPRHAAEDCPIAFRAMHKDRWLEWRVVDGVLMREVIDDEGKSMHPSRLAKDPSSRNYNNDTITDFFRDHPETVFDHPKADADRMIEMIEPRSRIEASMDGVEGSARLPRTPNFWKWLEDGRAEAEARVQSMAEKDLAVVQGTLFKRAIEPMIQVGCKTTHQASWINLIEVDLCIVEQGNVNFSTATWFRADEMEAAELMVQTFLEAPEGSPMFAPHALSGPFQDAELPRAVAPQRPRIEITGAWEPRAEAHQAAVLLTGAFMPTGGGIASEQSTAMGINALHLSARHPVLGPSIIPTDEAWTLFKRMAIGKDASPWHHAMVETDLAGEGCRTRIIASKEEGLTNFAI